MTALYEPRPEPYLPNWKLAPVPGWNVNPRVGGPPSLGQAGVTTMADHYSVYWRAHPLADWQWQHYLFLNLVDYVAIRDRYRQFPKPFYFANFPQWAFYNHRTHEFLS